MHVSREKNTLWYTHVRNGYTATENLGGLCDNTKDVLIYNAKYKKD